MKEKAPRNCCEAHIDNAAYEAWFIRQVQASIDDPRPSISDEEVRKLMAEKREKLRRGKLL
ncbi:antitoxin PaaA2 family protein [Pseudomonas sp. MDT1-17]